MDITTLILIILLIAFFRTPFVKGLYGEFLVNFTINGRLNKNIYHLLKDVTLPIQNGTTQIDHIIISQYGIFVLETKNMKGWIFGDEHQKIWTQKIYKNTNKFQNPLHQNYKHIKTLESILKVDLDKMFSIIVFVGDSTFKTEMPNNVTYASGFISLINSKTKKLFSEKEVENIILTIENKRLSKTIKTHFAHAQNVKNIVKEKNNKNFCPKCGSELVLRIAKKGINKGNKFYGCSSFPRCKHTSQIT